MAISLNPISPNCNEVILNGWTLLFSYRTLVALCSQHGERYQTAAKYSNTTSKHLALAGFKSAQKVDQAVLESMAAALVQVKP